MSVFGEAAALTALLALLSLFVGRLFAVAARVPLLLRPTAEALVGCAVLGTALVALAFGWGSHLGLAARPCLGLVATLLAGLTAFVARRRHLGEVVRLPARRGVLVLVGLAAAVRVGLCLLPLFTGRTYYLFCDAMTYGGAAEWLQGHGFGSPAAEGSPFPLDHILHEFQRDSHRMGPMFLLALLRAALPGRHAVELLPAVVAWGAALNVGGVFLLCRWSLGLARPAAVAGAFLAAVAYGSLNLSVTESFLCQIYGTATLSFALALLSRLQAPANWRGGNALLLGAAFAAQTSAYGELTPVAGAAALAVALAAWRRRPTLRRRLARFAAVVAGALLLVGNIEVVRAARAVPVMLARQGVGRHIAWDAVEYVGFAVGYYPHHMFHPTDAVTPTDRVATAAAALCCLAGVVWLVRRRRALPTTTALGVLLTLAICFAVVVRDPWTGAPGHTWNLFKICKWSVGLVGAAQAAGLALFLRRRLALAAACAVAAAVTLPQHLDETRRIVAGMRDTLGRDSTLRHLRAFHRRIAEIAPPAIYYIDAPTGVWPRCFPGFALAGVPFANDWRASWFFAAGALNGDRPEFIGPQTLFLQRGEPPFEAPRERLPFGHSIVDGTRPFVFRLDNPVGRELRDVGGATRLGAEPALLWTYAPRAGPAALTLVLRPEGTTGGRRFRLVDAEGHVHFLGAGDTRVTLRLPAGVDRLELTCLDASDEPGDFAAELSRVRLAFAADTPGAAEECEK